jgi:hypothetical protein
MVAHAESGTQRIPPWRPVAHLTGSDKTDKSVVPERRSVRVVHLQRPSRFKACRLHDSITGTSALLPRLNKLPTSRPSSTDDEPNYGSSTWEALRRDKRKRCRQRSARRYGGAGALPQHKAEKSLGTPSGRPWTDGTLVLRPRCATLQIPNGHQS